MQIYDPALDQWSAGTPLPNNNQYKAFGASGAIIGDTIYYFGGASTGSNFPAQDKLRIGVIDPLVPTTITWLPAITAGLGPRYRSGCAVVDGAPTWIGGSAVSYNYNAVAYNGSGLVQPATMIQQWNGSAMMSAGNTVPQVMDLRGVGEIGGNNFVIAGGIGAGQAVLDSAWLLVAGDVGIDEMEADVLRAWPNPTSDRCLVIIPEGSSDMGYTFRDALGRSVHTGTRAGTCLMIDLCTYAPGIYLLELGSGNRGSSNYIRLMRE
ncbi:MAG: T9SS type A sorting domain-containing protein [Flavobacteriales bacterium]|nr:T9SS type A sorting domain-containing protein [Flavobacteriales bacterium]